MKSFLLVAVLGALVYFLPANAVQTQPSQQKLEVQGELKLGQAQTRTLAPEVIHVWNLALEKGQYVVVEVLQKGIDVVVRIVDSNGIHRSEFDSPIGTAGTEKAVWITTIAGSWKVEIVPLDAKQPGDYEIKWTVQREATESHRQMVEADSLNNLAGLYHVQRNDVEAEPLYRRSLSIREKVLGLDHPSLAVTCYNLAKLYEARGNYNQAELFYRRALEIDEKALGPEHYSVAIDLNNLAWLYYTQGKYNEAETLYQRALKIYEKTLGLEHPYVAYSFANLGSVYQSQAKYAKAEPLFRRALAIWEKARGPDHPEVATGLMNLAWLYESQANYIEAEPLLRRSLEIREKALGPEHPDVAFTLNKLGELYNAQANYSKAEQFYKRSLSIWEKTLGPEHPFVAWSLHNLAMLYDEQGKFAEAEPLCKRALEIREKTLGAEHPYFATSLNNLAALYMAQGKYGEAEPLFRKVISINEKTLGPNHPDLAITLSNLAWIYRIQSRYTEAEKLLFRSLEITEKSLGPNHPRLALTLANLAFLFRDQGDYAKAEAFHQRSLVILEKALGPDHPDMAQSLSHLANLYNTQSMYVEAKPLYRRALEIYEKTLGPDHPRVANSLFNLANAMFLSGENPENVLPFTERAIRILNIVKRFPDWWVDVYSLQAQLNKRKGDWERALYELAEALRIAETRRPEIGGGEEARASFFERYKYADLFNRMAAWQLETGQIEKALEYAERGRARVFLDQLAAVKIDLLNSIPREDKRIALEKRQTNARARMAEYQRRINLLPSGKDIAKEEKEKQITALKDSLQTAEKEYQQIWEEIKLASLLWQKVITSGGQPVALATIQQTLVPEKGLILFYQIGKEESHLFVIPPTGQETEIVSLQFANQDTSVLQVKKGSVKSTDLQKILADSSAGLLRYLKTNPDAAKSEQEESATAKLQALWHVLLPDSIWPKVKTCAEVIIIPDGLLHQLPFEALVVQSGKKPADTRYWINEGPVIRYAPSATILYSLEKRQMEKSPAQPSILSLSDPIFDLEAIGKEMQKQIASRGATPQDSTTTKSSGLMETLLAETRSKEREFAGPLPRLFGTDTETNYIRQYFGAKNVKALRQLQADEPHLRANIQGKRYVHLATHGLVELQQSSLSNALALTPPPKDTVNSENDGFLKLYEIYELKLNACDLAVLSACETHFGRLFVGEGVFALSRGFLAAGAARVVASHWQVQDISTAELVGAFFRSIAIAEKNDKPVDYALALRDAKLKLRRDKNRRQWAAPYFWAPFIITGKR